MKWAQKIKDMPLDEVESMFVEICNTYDTCRDCPTLLYRVCTGRDKSDDYNPGDETI